MSSVKDKNPYTCSFCGGPLELCFYNLIEPSYHENALHGFRCQRCGYTTHPEYTNNHPRECPHYEVYILSFTKKLWNNEGHSAENRKEKK